MKKVMLLVGILVLIVAAYAAFHAVAYFSILRFFAITNPAAQKTLLWIFVFLGCSFFAATFLSHWHDDIFTRAYYFFAGSWIGLLVNLVLFFVLAWAIVGISSLFGIAPKEKILALIVVYAAITYSAYGIWNAFSQTVTHVDISIADLPESWVGKKIVQISDVHLGHIYSPRYMEGLAQKVSALKPDAIVITGDLFDGTDGSLDIFTQSLNGLVAPDGIYYVTGNHETYLGVEKVSALINKTKIIELKDQMREVDGLQFVGIDYPQRMDSKDIGAVIAGMSGFDPQKPSILLWHIPTQIEAAKKAGISLQLSGHTHNGQLFPFGFVTKLIFKGYDYGYKKEGNYSIYTSSGLGGWGPPMRTEKTSEIVEIKLY